MTQPTSYERLKPKEKSQRRRQILANVSQNLLPGGATPNDSTPSALALAPSLSPLAKQDRKPPRSITAHDDFAASAWQCVLNSSTYQSIQGPNRACRSSKICWLSAGCFAPATGVVLWGADVWLACCSGPSKRRFTQSSGIFVQGENSSVACGLLLAAGCHATCGIVAEYCPASGLLSVG